ncbi:SHOCT domain-containing protein [Desulfoferrobacter suflitae]|uniref:SHOCT domain-containing protein n=1 Tax=Desulfoferrobacter suflitae TaxID=2865782 RepID=UPI0021640BD1|nr:SHOCT domain-containing protein [Desulfoferrobacter suflitae]MCK8600454.1 SHOCT domain-containing protein [Desulfoferrobacter suflitae]
MEFRRMLTIVLLLLAGLHLAGCCGGSSSKEKIIVEKQVPAQQTVAPTLGKQLDDLKEAYKKGIITREEFEAGKRKLLGEQ